MSARRTMGVLSPLMLVLMACARPPPAPDPTSVRRTEGLAPPPAVPALAARDAPPLDGPRGWYVVVHCAREAKGAVIKHGSRGVHFEGDLYTSYADGYVVRRTMKFKKPQATGSGAWTTFSATFDIGRAR